MNEIRSNSGSFNLQEQTEEKKIFSKQGHPDMIHKIPRRDLDGLSAYIRVNLRLNSFCFSSRAFGSIRGGRVSVNPWTF